MSFSRQRWHPGEQILKAGPCKRGNNKLQRAEQRLTTTDLCLLRLRGSGAPFLDAAKEGIILSALWPPGHPFSSRRLANVYYGVSDYGKDEMSWCFLIAVAAFSWIQSNTEPETSAGAELPLFFFFFCTVAQHICSTFKAIIHFTSIHLIPFFFRRNFLLASELRWMWTRFSGRLHSHGITHAHHKLA